MIPHDHAAWGCKKPSKNLGRKRLQNLIVLMFIVMSVVEEPDLIFIILGNSCFFSNTSLGSFISSILCGSFRSSQHSLTITATTNFTITVRLCIIMMAEIFWAIATMIYRAVATMMAEIFLGEELYLAF